MAVQIYRTPGRLIVASQGTGSQLAVQQLNYGYTIAPIPSGQVGVNFGTSYMQDPVICSSVLQTYAPANWGVLCFLIFPNGLNPPTITLTPSTLEGNVTVITGSGTQTLNSTATSGTFTITSNNMTSADINYNCTNANIAAVMLALTSGVVTVTGGPLPTPIIINTSLNISINTIPVPGSMTVTNLSSGNVQISSTETRGTFILFANGTSSMPIDYNASALDVSIAIEAFINGTVTGGPLPGTPIVLHIFPQVFGSVISIDQTLHSALITTDGNRNVQIIYSNSDSKLVNGINILTIPQVVTSNGYLYPAGTIGSVYYSNGNWIFFDGGCGV